MRIAEGSQRSVLATNKWSARNVKLRSFGRKNRGPQDDNQCGGGAEKSALAFLAKSS